jgi:hypothetical protein
LALSALFRDIDFRQNGSMTRIAAQSILLLRINAAFARVREMVEAFINQLPNVDRSPSSWLPTSTKRRDGATDALRDTAILKNIFRWAGSRAKVVEETVHHFYEYSDLLVSSISESAAVMMVHLQYQVRGLRDERPAFCEELKQKSGVYNHKKIEIMSSLEWQNKSSAHSCCERRARFQTCFQSGYPQTRKRC